MFEHTIGRNFINFSRAHPCIYISMNLFTVKCVKWLNAHHQHIDSNEVLYDVQR